MSVLTDFADKLLARVDIVQVVQNYVPLKRAGVNYRGLCPFHREKTPSFNVSPTKQIFHCFGCGVGGNAIRFLMMIEHLEWMEAVKLLAQKHGIALPELPHHREERTAQDARKKLYEVSKLACEYFAAKLQKALEDPTHPAARYLASRKITPELAARFSLGLAPSGWTEFYDAARQAGFESQTIISAGLAVRHDATDRVYDRFRNRIIFPICDSLGRPVAFGARVYAPDAAPTEPKYINSPETPIYRKGQHLFALHLAKDAIVRQGYALLMEGYLDVIRAHQFGFTNAVATCGTALTEEQAAALKRLTSRVLFAYDGDEAGQKAMLRGCEVLLDYELGIEIVVLPNPHDPDSFLLEEGAEPFADLVAKPRDFIEFFLDKARERYGCDSVLAKVESVKFLSPVLRKIRNAVAQREYVRLVASRLDVDVAALAKQLTEKRSAEPNNKDLAAVLVPTQATDSRLECLLLKLVVEEPRVRSFLFEHVSADWLTSPRVRKWYERCRTLDEDAKSMDWQSLLRECADEQEEDARFLRALAFAEGEPTNEITEEELAGVVARLRRAHLQQLCSSYCSTLQQLYPNDPEGEQWGRLVRELNAHHPLLRDTLLVAQRTSILRALPNFGNAG